MCSIPDPLLFSVITLPVAALHHHTISSAFKGPTFSILILTRLDLPFPFQKILVIIRKKISIPAILEG